MTLSEARHLATMLYFTATGRHDIDESQWNIILDVINKKYWNDLVSKVPSIIARDTPDLYTDGFGQLDFSGNVFTQNDFNYGQMSNLNTAGGWSAVELLTSQGFFAPDGSKTAWKLTDTVNNAEHIIQISGIEPSYKTGDGAATILAKAGTKNFLFISPDSGSLVNQFFNLASGTLGQGGSDVTGAISPAPAPGFPWSQTASGGGTSAISPSGWYKCTAAAINTKNMGTNFRVGIADADGVSSYAGSASTPGTVFVWGPRKYLLDNIVDPVGIHIPLSVELRFQGRYLHLDYEITQDRYIYNIAFGQVQVLIPSAWTLIGEKILLLPRTSTPQPIRVTYVPRIVDLVHDSQQLLNGLLTTYHPMMVYEVAASMAGDAKKPVFMPLGEMRQQWTAFLQKGRQRQTGRQIRFIPYE